EYLDALASDLHQAALTVQTVVPYGEPAEWIVAEARQREVDLIAMATGCRTGLGGWWHRSVTKRVIAQSPVPVLLVCGDELLREMAPFDERPRLMVPLDGSPSSERALPVATQLSTELSGALVLMRIVPSAEPIEWVYGHEAVELFGVQGEIEDLKIEAEEYLRIVAERLAEEDVDTRTEVCSGARAECVRDTSRRHGVSLVVLCTDTDDRSSSLVEQLRPTGMPLLLVPHPVHETCTSAEGT
ncbi:MAG: universal stress protein, partial [Chloroflexota bacterium]|nr:universal stress protein [Chloroflexota bacterium]